MFAFTIRLCWQLTQFLFFYLMQFLYNVHVLMEYKVGHCILDSFGYAEVIWSCE